MLDNVSMVFYTVTAAYDGNEYYFESKINRCMFHYGEDKLIQGRVYPQDNDSNADNIYKDIREIVQKVIADCEGISNYWTTKKGVCDVGDYVRHGGTNYPDYRYYNNCCVSFPKENEINSTPITVGAKPICIYCGKTHSCEENISCCANGYECESCGEYVDEDDIYWVNGNRYCRECVTYCEHCEEYVLVDDATWVESVDANICDDCLSEHYVYCERCDEYHRNEHTTYLDRYDISVCDDCLEEYYTECDECGEYVRNGSITYIHSTGRNYCEDCLAEMEVNK